MKRNLYDALEVSQTASEDEIRKNYRKLARKYHPDLNQDDKDAEERFKEIAVAYEYLSDKEKRKNYDEFGEEALDPNFDPARAREFKRWRGARATGSSRYGGSPFQGGVDISDLFSDLFGRSGGRGGFNRAHKVRGSDVESKVRIPLLDSLRGTKVKFKLTGLQSCKECQGTGQQVEESTPCKACHGTGQQNIGGGPLPLTGPCQVCGGSGRTRGPACTHCSGRGAVEEPSTITVTIPSGVDNGAKIRLTGKGEPGLGGSPSGDLYLKVEVTPHPKLTREGDNLIVKLPVTIAEAILGATVSVPLFDGEAKVKVPAGSQSGQKLRLKGKGAPRRKGKEAGDLILILDVRLPKNGGNALEEAAKAMEPLYDDDVRADLKL